MQASPANFKGRDALMVELTPEAQKALLAGTGTGNGPSYMMPHVQLANGTIEVDLAARINGKGAHRECGRHIGIIDNAHVQTCEASRSTCKGEIGTDGEAQKPFERLGYNPSLRPCWLR